MTFTAGKGTEAFFSVVLVIRLRRFSLGIDYEQEQEGLA